MFPDQSLGSLELQYKAVFDVQIRYEGAQERTVFIVHLKLLLLLNRQANFRKAVRQSILIHLLKVTIPEIFM